MSKKSPTASRYFVTTLLFFLILPNVLYVPFMGIAMAVESSVGNSVLPVAIASLGALVFCFFAFLWGKNKTKIEEGSVPADSALYRVSRIYFPTLIPLIYQCVLSSVVMIFEGNSSDGWNIFSAQYLGVIFSFDLFGGSLALEAQISPILGHIIVNAAFIASFALGERLTAKRLGIKRKLSIKPFAVTAGALAAVFGLCCFGKWYYGLGRVEFDRTDFNEQIQIQNGYDPEYRYLDHVQGYGFPYENGWSSVDLAPYYVENPENRLAKLSAPSALVITDPEKMPRLDGAEAAYPVYSAFANACYEGVAEIQTAEKAKLTDADKHYTTYRRGGTPVCFTNTIEAFKGLVSGDVDIFFGARPSAEQQKLAEDAGKTLVLTPIAKEAFVFIVSEDNPVDGLSSEQIRDIYSGKYTNWAKVGGFPAPILAFQRPENSGSQTMMKYFMGDAPLKEPVEGEYYSMMEGVIRATASYQNKLSSIGYSFRYYTMGMSDEGGEGIKLLSLDGIYPDEESISSGEYPMTTALYAITLAENDNEYIAPMLEWMTGEQGQEIVEKTGYVSVG